MTSTAEAPSCTVPPTAQRGSRVPYGASLKRTPASGRLLPGGSTRSSSAPSGRPSVKPSRTGSRVSSALPHVALPTARPVSGSISAKAWIAAYRTWRPVSRARSSGWSWMSPSASKNATSCRPTTSASRSSISPAMRSSRSRRTCRHQAGGNGSPGPIAARMFQVATRKVVGGEAASPPTSPILRAGPGRRSAGG